MELPDLGEAEGTVVLVAGGIALLAVWYVYRKASDVASAASEALGQAWDTTAEVATNVVTKDLNPVSDQNLANRANNGLFDWLTGSTQSIGGALYDVLHPHAFDNNPTPYPGTAPPYSDQAPVIDYSGAMW